MAKKGPKCSKVCWELMDLVEHQAGIIKKLTLQIKELEAILAGAKIRDHKRH